MFGQMERTQHLKDCIHLRYVEDWVFVFLFFGGGGGVQGSPRPVNDLIGSQPQKRGKPQKSVDNPGGGSYIAYMYICIYIYIYSLVGLIKYP